MSYCKIYVLHSVVYVFSMYCKSLCSTVRAYVCATIGAHVLLLQEPMYYCKSPRALPTSPERFTVQLLQRRQSQETDGDVRPQSNGTHLCPLLVAMETDVHAGYLVVHSHMTESSKTSQ